MKFKTVFRGKRPSFYAQDFFVFFVCISSRHATLYFSRRTEGHSTDETQEIIHKCSNGEDIVGVHSRAHNLQADLIILLYNNFLVLRLVARRIHVRIEFHIWGNGVARDETRQRSDLREEACTVHLSHHSVQYLTFERSEHDGFVFDGIDDEPTSRLYVAGADVVDCGDGDDKSVFTRTSPLDFGEEFLFHRVKEVGPEVARVEKNVMFQRYMVKHFNSLLLEK